MKQLEEEMNELIKLENEGVKFIPNVEKKTSNKCHISSDLTKLGKETVDKLLVEFKQHMDTKTI